MTQDGDDDDDVAPHHNAANILLGVFSQSNFHVLFCHACLFTIIILVGCLALYSKWPPVHQLAAVHDIECMTGATQHAKLVAIGHGTRPEGSSDARTIQEEI